MKASVAPYLAGIAVLGAAGWALVHKDDSVPEPAAQVAPPEPAEPAGQPPSNDSFLPPDHPPVGQGSGASPHGAMGGMGPMSGMSGGDDAPAITWTVPAKWQTAPNPSSMRIATYHPSAAIDVSISRAGGATDANIERWMHQFDNPGAPKRSQTKVKGIDVQTVEVTGTYLGGGMMTGTAPEPRTGWSLVGAVVETPGFHYFFKMIGPAADVTAAKSGFDALVQSITPTTAPTSAPAATAK